MDGQQYLNRVLVAWDKAADEFQNATNEEARALVAWERFAAATRIRLKAESLEKLTVSDLDALILDADSEGLYEAAKVKSALVVGLRKRLDVYAAQVDAARTEIASDRQRERAWMASPAVPQGGRP